MIRFTSLLLLLLSACSGATSTNAAAPVPVPVPANSATPAMIDSTLRPRVELALADAAKRVGVDASTLVVESAEQVTWSDGAVGCPEKGMMYTQMLVPGYRIVIKSGATALAYHGSMRGQPFFCPANRVRSPSSIDPTR